MGTTFVTLGRDADGAPADADRQVGFWMRDHMLALWLRLLALHVREPDSGAEAAHIIRNQWLRASSVIVPGMMDHGLDEATATPEGFDIVRQAVLSLSQALSRSSKPLPGATLDLIGIEGMQWGDEGVDVASLRQIAAAFMDLMYFKVASTAGTPVSTPGSAGPYVVRPGD